jgi:hypothetical protein
VARSWLLRRCKVRIPRKKGAFLWEQFAVATKLQVQSVFVGMFDELDEGTQLLKVTNSPPVQAAGDIGYEGMPSDVYLCWAGKGTAMVRGVTPYNATVPNCPGFTQPTIPTAFPTATHSGRGRAAAALQWSAALALEGGGRISHYEIAVDGVVRKTKDATSTSVVVEEAVLAALSGDGSTATGGIAGGSGGSGGDGADQPHHWWRVRAVNTLGNAGGWSLRQAINFSPPLLSPSPPLP